MSFGGMEKGSVIHYVFEKILNSRIQGTPITFQDVEGWINESMRENPASMPFHDMIRASCMNLLQHQIPYAEHMIETEKKVAIKYDGTETEFDFPGEGDRRERNPDCFARAIIDVYAEVGDEAIIIDHKTQPYTENALTPKMEFYAWVIAKANPHINKVSVILHFCHPDINWFSHPIKLDRSQLIPDPTIMMSTNREETVEERIMAQIEYVESYYGQEVLPTVPNTKCEYCPLYFDCAARKDVENAMVKSGVQSAKTPEEAEALLKKMIVLEDWLDMVKSALKEYVRREDAMKLVQYGDYVYGTKHYTSVDYNVYPDKVEAWLKKQRLDPNLYKIFDKEKLNTLVTRHIEDIKALTELRAIVPEKKTSKSQKFTMNGFLRGS
jgi:hypothetical protein